jgi:hypothetical protein
LRFIRDDFASRVEYERSSNSESRRTCRFLRDMSSNDAQMDVLLRRHAGKMPAGSTTEHLDADELSAFAEGKIPATARSRYVSHLVDCDNCRQLVSQLAMSSGAVAAESNTAVEPSGYSWSKRLARFLSPMTLRYAALAVVLITVAGVVLLVTQRSRDSNRTAQNESTHQATAVKPSGEATAPNAGYSQVEANNNKTLANQPTPAAQASPSDQIAKLDQPRPAETFVLPPKPAKEPDTTTGTAQKKAESTETEKAPAYSPLPPPIAAQQSPTQGREQQSIGGAAPASGPRKSADQFGMMSKSRPAGEENKDNGANDKQVLADRPAPASRRGSDEKLKGPRRDMDNNATLSRNADDTRSRNAQGMVTQNQVEEKPLETRSVGGRKFRREGNAWVDVKFKSSMPVKSISRGSSEFDELDSDLRSIAKQLGGQILVVRKNKAYLIK